MKLADYDYHLPEDRIAQFPVQRRDASRLMVVDRSLGRFHHTQFAQIGEFLPQPALLVLNNTKVIPARLIGQKIASQHQVGTGNGAPGAKIEFLLLDRKDESVWEVLVKPGKRVSTGTRVVFGDGQLTARVLARTERGSRLVRFRYDGDFYAVLSEVGSVPLPPYIKRTPTPIDDERYQCVYAESEGAVAAPTAGLHFTPELFARLKAADIETVELTLHVGLGTFQPVKVTEVEAHKMHAEYFEISDQSAARLNGAMEQKEQIVAVGTTSVRAVETATSGGGRNTDVTSTVLPYQGYTDIFIYPGYRFKAIDALITNFHLPKSTLLMLVSAFAGHELIREAYQEAIKQKYRFYSYGDAMLIL